MGVWTSLLKPLKCRKSLLNRGDSLLHVYSRDGSHYRGRPESLCSRRHYHSIRRNDGTRDNTVEQILANDVEADGIAALRKLASGQLSQFERANLCVYMAIQYLRTPHMRGNFEETFARMLDHVIRRNMVSRDRFAALMAEGKLRPELAGQLKALYLKGQIKLEVKPEFSLLEIFAQSDVYAAAMANWKWEVVTSSTAPFITSDCPVHFAENRHVALMDPDAVLHFPLTAAAMLVMRFAEPEDKLWEQLSSIIPKRYLQGFVVWDNYVDHREARDGEVDELNIITVSMCENNIYVGTETNAFDEVLSAPSENVQLKVTTSRDEIRLTMVGGNQTPS